MGVARCAVEASLEAALALSAEADEVSIKCSQMLALPKQGLLIDLLGSKAAQARFGKCSLSGWHLRNLLRWWARPTRTLASFTSAGLTQQKCTLPRRKECIGARKSERFVPKALYPYR